VISLANSAFWACVLPGHIWTVIMGMVSPPSHVRNPVWFRLVFYHGVTVQDSGRDIRLDGIPGCACSVPEPRTCKMLRQALQSSRCFR
jgi:hypothetical protein